MKKIAFVLAAAGLMSLAACKSHTAPVANTADATNANLTNEAAALDNQVSEESNATANAETNQATQLNGNVDNVRAEASNTTK